MPDQTTDRQRRFADRSEIQVLPAAVAQRIAAGEVIDRPQAVVRELLDNALDSGADNITTELALGGSALVAVVDNGAGMSRDDLALCYLPHATSKIRSEADLLEVHSLGFRGEALAAIATVSKLSITSLTAGTTHRDAPGADTAHRLMVHGGEFIAISPAAGAAGTVVRVEDLFFNVPARKRFLKKPVSETALCRSVLIDKAAAFPETAFRLVVDGKLRDEFTAAAGTGFRPRLIDCYRIDHHQALAEISAEDEGFRLSIVVGAPQLFRRDRKLLQVFVNRRRIWEYSLTQAVERAFHGYLPGGNYPVAFVYVEVDPARVDFNIHPAKREAKFQDLRLIQERIAQTVGRFLATPGGRVSRTLPSTRSLESSAAETPPLGPGDGRFAATSRFAEPYRQTPQPTAPRYSAQQHGAPADAGLFAAAQRDGTRGPAAPLRPGDAYDVSFPKPSSGLEPRHESPAIRYLGTLFELFLVAEIGHRAYFVDFHAAHERLLFDDMRAQARPTPLLMPYEFAEDDEERNERLFQRIKPLESIGIAIAPADPPEAATVRWQLSCVPAAFAGDLQSLVEEMAAPAGDDAEIERFLYARMACRAAAKHGDYVDAVRAIELIRAALQLPNPRCPHGRPLWFEVTKDDLYRLMGR